MEAALQEVFSSYAGRKNELIPILQDVQEHLGYLPEEAMREIARYTGVPESRVYAVATFYTMFRFTPIGKYHFMVCRGTACHVKGAPRIVERLERELGIGVGETTSDKLFTLQTVRCLGCCGLAPVVTIGEDLYGKLNPAKAAALLEKNAD